MKDTGAMRVQTQRPRLTSKVDLPGGQDRLRQMILYISIRCTEAERFGQVKLNKILWRADFESFAARQRPVTGRPYQRLPQGPAAKEMVPVMREMIRDGLIEIFETDFGDGFIEKRPVARAEPKLTALFTDDDLRFVDQAIIHYWDMTGGESSDESHGIAWKSRGDKAPMYYELSYLSDEPVSSRQLSALADKLRATGWSRRSR